MSDFGYATIHCKFIGKAALSMSQYMYIAKPHTPEYSHIIRHTKQVYCTHIHHNLLQIHLDGTSENVKMVFYHISCTQSN